MDLIIKNGTVVNSHSVERIDVGIEGGRITALAERLDVPGAQVADAKGLLVLPGAVDAHVHLQMPFGGTTSADSYEAGTRAAVCGGVTTVLDYAIQRKGRGIVETVAERRALAEPQACCDIGFHCGITDLNEGDSLLDEFEAAREYGVSSFKCFMVYRKEGMMIDDGKLLRILERTRSEGIVVNIHAENADVIDDRVAGFLREGKTSAWYHYRSRPEAVEAEAVKRAIHWAETLRAPGYIVLLACQEGMRAVAEARAHGVPVFAETCPQYLEFTSDVYRQEDARNFVCSPPIKGAGSRAALWEGINRGYIDTVATDHCPFMLAEKDWGKDDFTRIPNGCAGVENLYPYMLASHNTEITRAVELCSAKPAAIFGCETKGAIAVGKDADIVLYDPTRKFTVGMDNMHSDYDHTIWDGLDMTGYPVKTFLRGKLVYDNGRYVGKPGDGRYIARGQSGSPELRPWSP
jgi:dihydropyrimidinase